MTTSILRGARSRRTWIVAAVVATAVTVAITRAVAGWTGTAEVRRQSAHPPVSAVPVLLDSAHLPLPLEPYLLSDRQLDTLTTARNVLLSRCAARFGVTLPAPPQTRNLGPLTYTERRYGLTDPALAAEDGYHLGPRDPRTIRKAPGPELSPTQELVVGGMPADSAAASTPRVVHGQRLPSGGCLGEADRRLGGSWDDPDIVEAIDTDSVVRASKDRRVVAAFRAWSACMRAKGHRYATPWDAGNDPRFTGPHSSPAEIAVATADVACKRKTNVVGVWYATDAAVQKSLIEQHTGALDRAKKDKDAHLRVAARTLLSS